MLRRKKTPVGRQPRGSSRQTAPVFSYRANRSPDSTNLGRGEEQKVQAQRAKRGRWRHIPTYIALGVIGGSLLYCTLLVPDAKLVIQDTPGAKEELRSPDTYQQSANQKLGSLLNRNKLTINTQAVASQLQEQYPELGKVTVGVPLIGKRPVVTVKPVQPALVINGTGGNYVIDTTGRAIARTTELPQIARVLTVVTDQSGLEIKPGKRILPEESVAFITTLIQQLQAKNIKTSAILLPAVPNELDVRIDGQPYVIKTNLLGDARLQAGMYLAAKNKLDSTKTTPAEVVDVRIEERVYYK